MWFRSQPRRWSAHRTAFCRPQLEVLEDRLALSTLTVNTTADVLGHDGGQLSLRQAVLDANANPGRDTIVMPAGSYQLSLGELGVTDDLSVSAAGADPVSVIPDAADRIFHVLGAKLDLSDLSLLPPPTWQYGDGADLGSNCQMLWMAAWSGGVGLLHPIGKPYPGDHLC